MSWTTTWLNCRARNYMSRRLGEGGLVFDHPSLQDVSTPAEHPLPVTVLAACCVCDRDDIELLLDGFRITTLAGVWATVERYIPDAAIPDRARPLVDDLLQR
jgi:hypothetical protein